MTRHNHAVNHRRATMRELSPTGDGLLTVAQEGELRSQCQQMLNHVKTGSTLHDTQTDHGKLCAAVIDVHELR